MSFNKSELSGFTPCSRIECIAKQWARRVNSSDTGTSSAFPQGLPLRSTLNSYTGFNDKQLVRHLKSKIRYRYTTES